MKGVIKGFSADHVRFAVLTDYGFTVFDIEIGEAAYGHIVTGSLDDHGPMDLRNETTGQTISVCIEAIHATKEAAETLLRQRR